jgi:hypothetical protein
MKHNLDHFADGEFIGRDFNGVFIGIQPFQNSHVNEPTHFMKRLKMILKKKPEEGEIP